MTFSPVVNILQSSDGTSIYAEAIGDPTKPAVILAHGMTLCSATFDNLFSDKRLLDALYLVRYDLRGHGRSGMPSTMESYSSSLYADDYVAVLRAFGLKKVVHLAWSYGATVVTDVCANMHPHPFSGLVYIAPLPYVGPIMQTIGTSIVLGFLPGLMNANDSALSARTKVAFVDSVFADPAGVDFNLKMAWVGQASLQPPEVSKCITSRPQDPEKFFEAGRAGLPMLVLNGTADSQVMGDAVVRELTAPFKNLEAHMIEGGGHALFYDKQEECVLALLDFVRRVTAEHSSS